MIQADKKTIKQWDKDIELAVSDDTRILKMLKVKQRKQLEMEE